jgi:hypothetical protein
MKNGPTLRNLSKCGMGVLLLTLALVSITSVEASSWPLDFQQASIAGTPSASNGVFRIQVGAWVKGYGFPQYSVRSSHFTFALVRDYWGGQVYGSISANAAVYYGGGQYAFQLNYNNYIASHMLPHGSYTVHWHITVYVISAGQTFTASKDSGSMQIYN